MPRRTMFRVFLITIAVFTCIVLMMLALAVKNAEAADLTPPAPVSPTPGWTSTPWPATPAPVITIVPQPGVDLSVSAELDPTSGIDHGESFAMNFRIVNSGSYTATNVILNVRHPLPTSWSLNGWGAGTPVGVTYWGYIFSSNGIRFAWSHLAPGQSVDVSLYGTAGAGFRIEETAQVTSTEYDFNSADNTFTLRYPAPEPALPDWSVRVELPVEAPRIGQPYQPIVSVTNKTPVIANGIFTLTVAPQFGTTMYPFVSNYCVITYSDKTQFVCPIVLGPGETFTTTLEIWPTQTGQMAVSVAAMPHVGDADTEDNVFWQNPDVLGTVDLVVSPSLWPPEPLYLGEPATYAFEISNAGTTTATNVVVYHRISAKAEITGIELGLHPYGIGAASSQTQLPISIDELAPGQIVSVRITIVPKEVTQSFVFETTVSSQDDEESYENNSWKFWAQSSARYQLWLPQLNR
jgi:hypothetical protein